MHHHAEERGWSKHVCVDDLGYRQGQLLSGEITPIQHVTSLPNDVGMVKG